MYKETNVKQTTEVEDEFNNNNNNKIKVKDFEFIEAGSTIKIKKEIKNNIIFFK